MKTEDKMKVLCENVMKLAQLIEQAYYMNLSPLNPCPGMTSHQYYEAMETLKAIKGNVRAVSNNLPQLVVPVK